MTTIGVITLTVGVAIVILCSVYYAGYSIGVTKGRELAAIEWDWLVQQAIQHSHDIEAEYKAAIKRYQQPIKEYAKFLETLEKDIDWNAIEKDYLRKQIEKETNPPPTC